MQCTPVPPSPSPPPACPQSPLHPRLSPAAKDLLEGMLRVKPRDRLSLEAVLTHTWLSPSPDSAADLTATDAHLGDEYTHRVKALTIRRKLKSIFVPLLSPPATPREQEDVASTSGADVSKCSETRTNEHAQFEAEAEARYYFDVIVEAAAAAAAGGAPGGGAGGGGSGREVSRAGLRAGMAKLLSDDSGPHEPPRHAGHSRGHHCVSQPDGGGHDGGGAELRLTPGVGVCVDEMFDIIRVNEEDTIDFDKFRKFYLIVMRGHA